MSQNWLFDTPSPWIATVPAAPKFETYRQYFAIAVPAIARGKHGPAKTPCIVVARVTARPAQGRSQPGGPKDRAKGLMDALHDDRTNGPKYRDLGAVAPLPDDHGEYVHGLAVQVQPGDSDQVEYRLGDPLEVSGRLLGSIDVPVSAPNDIWSDARMRARVEEARAIFCRELVNSCSKSVFRSRCPEARALVVRHRPGRDEDNTWGHWISALTGGGAWSKALWPSPGSPFSGWSPTAIASAADPTLPCEVRYEVFG